MTEVAFSPEIMQLWQDTTTFAPKAPKFLIMLWYEFDLLQVSYLHYNTIRYNIQKNHYAYPYYAHGNAIKNGCRKSLHAPVQNFATACKRSGVI
jgi:hypothetical protein